MITGTVIIFYRYSGEIAPECGTVGENEGNGGWTEETGGLSGISGIKCYHKYRDLQKIADCYGKIAKFELIFTKLDETEAVGNLLNIKLYTDAPIAYVTCGQNVPDDMEMFNPQKTVKQILGGKE